MTPTDALIEKMARAIAEADGSSWEDELMHRYYRILARAAYSAEHEEDGK